MTSHLLFSDYPSPRADQAERITALSGSRVVNSTSGADQPQLLRDQRGAAILLNGDGVLPVGTRSPGVA